MSRIDRARLLGEEEGMGKGGKRISWEIFLGFGTSDLKQQGHILSSLMEEAASSP